MDLSTVTKRPGKKECLSFILNQFAAFKAGIITKEQCDQMFTLGSYFLYETEVKELLEKTKDDFDKKGFVGLLGFCKNVKQGDAPVFGSGVDLVRINSKERAAEVANDVEDVDQIVDIMNQIVALRDILNPLINKKSSCSIALKNKKEKELGITDPKPGEVPA